MYTINDVKNFQLFKQHLVSPKNKVFSERNLLDLLDSIGYIQLDSINVTNARSQDIFLWSRFIKYSTNNYTSLYSSGGIVEIYSRFLSLMTRSSPIVSKIHFINFFNLQKEKNYPSFLKTLNRLEITGPVYKKDFVKNRNSQHWNLSEADTVIDKLWRAGLIKISRDHAFRKIIEANKVDAIPKLIDIRTEKLKLSRELLLQVLNNLGATTKSDLFRNISIHKSLFEQAFDEAIQTQEISEIPIEGENYYMLSNDLPFFTETSIQPRNCALLIPFDNLIQDRIRTQRLFGFNYKLESYIPNSMRIHGYFALPILIHGEIVGTVDLRFNRRERRLDINRLVWRDKFKNNNCCLNILCDLLGDLEDFVTNQ
ncbi:crosslink repair DNA glycosylase YcaQ family protein [Lacticaseibacillus rhamnosus]